MMETRHYILRVAAFLAASTLALGLAGCLGDAPCTEIGCADNLECNARTGQCEELVRSCRPGSCPSGKVCDTATGLCHSEGARCVDDSCPGRQVCNAQTGFCEAQANCQVDSCHSSAEQCDPLSGQCVPRSCERDDECGTSFYCSSDNECRSGCRIGEEAGCPQGEFCRGSIDEVIGQCREECHSDEQCPLGQLCEQTREGSSCEAEPPCGDDQDCRDEGVCREGRCQPPPCTVDDDCTGEQVCERATGQCIGGSCQEDIHAPNQAMEQAAHLVPDRHTGLRLCAGKSDWFSVSLRSSDALSLRLEHESGADIDMYVWGEYGELLAANQRTGAVTVLEMLSQRSQTAAIQITAPAASDQLYDLEITRNPDQAFCRDDSSEENDHPHQAVVLPNDPGTPFELSLAICGADQDWFELPDLDARSGLVVTQTEADAHIDLELLAPDGRVFRLGETGSAEDTIRLERLGVGGDHLIRVRSHYARSGTYRLRTRVLEPINCPGAGDHASADRALSIPSNAVQSLPFCPLEDAWDVDWLELDPPDVASTLGIQVVSVGDLPALDVVLFEAGDQAPERVRRAALSGGSYQLRVPVDAASKHLLRLSADGAPGRVVDGVNYQVFYRYEPSD